MAYPGNWTANLSPDHRAIFEQMLSSNNKVLDRLREMCYNMINELESLSSDFDSPNWALRQANLIGQRRALEKIILLCTSAKEPDPVS